MKEHLKLLWLDDYDLVNEDRNRHLVEFIWECVQNEVCVVLNHNDTTSSKELDALSSKTDNDKNDRLDNEIIELIEKFCR